MWEEAYNNLHHHKLNAGGKLSAFEFIFEVIKWVQLRIYWKKYSEVAWLVNSEIWKGIVFPWISPLQRDKGDPSWQTLQANNSRILFGGSQCKHKRKTEVCNQCQKYSSRCQTTWGREVSKGIHGLFLWASCQEHEFDFQLGEDTCASGVARWWNVRCVQYYTVLSSWKPWTACQSIWMHFHHSSRMQAQDIGSNQD